MSDRDRLIETQLKAYKEWRNNTNLDISVAEFTTDYILADGWIRPPCKVGDTVWRVVTMGTGVRFKKVGYNSWREKEQTIKHFIRSVVVTENNFYNIVFGGSFGKTVFLTKEDAEEKLKELGK
jgi:hypothetical protein